MPIVIESVGLTPTVEGWFTGRDLEREPRPLAPGGNLAHRRPHRPDDLAADRAAVAAATGTDPSRWHLMQQVHGARVGIIHASTPAGAELRGVDALVTTQPDRPLGVLVADCVPVLLASERAVGVVHAGRRGLVAGVVAAALAALERLGIAGGELTAALGPAIGGCCYEVPAQLRDQVAEQVGEVAATTTREETPALDLPAAVRTELIAAGVAVVAGPDGCTRCDPDGRWFSHRADPSTGRQLGLLVRRREPTGARDRLTTDAVGVGRR
ncbi:MAG: polyphenol oxidase family protein [Nitriliruptoraceae bacterium]